MRRTSRRQRESKNGGEQPATLGVGVAASSCTFVECASKIEREPRVAQGSLNRPHRVTESIMTDEHLVALGRITVAYSQLEWAVSAFIWKLLSTDQLVGQTVTASLMFSARVFLLRSLFDLLEPAYGQKVNIPALDAALKQATDASARRNEVVHALLWLSTADGKDLEHTNLKPRKAAEWKTAPASVADLQSIAGQLTKAYEAVSKCMMDHFDGFGVEKAWGPMGAGSLFGLMATAALAFERTEQRRKKAGARSAS